MFDDIYISPKISKFGQKGSFKLIQNALSDSESPKLAMVANVTYKVDKKPTAIVVTDKRVIFACKQGFNENQFDIVLNNIQDIKKDTNNMMKFTVTIVTVNSSVQVDMTRLEFNQFYNSLRTI